MRIQVATSVAAAVLIGVVVLSACSGSTSNPAMDSAAQACELALGLEGSAAKGPIVAGDGARTLADIEWHGSRASNADPNRFGPLLTYLRYFTRAAATGGDVALTELAKVEGECQRVGAT